MSIALISSPACSLHEMGDGHPEQPARIQVIENALLHSELAADLKCYEATAASQEALARVHDLAYLEQIFSLSPAQGLLQLEPDTAMNPFTLKAALAGAGAAILGVDLVMAGEVEQAFCNIRPPGHHAERSRAMGFCFFNNVAVAAAHLLDRYHLQRVVIVDFDVHHGNGTENIFKQDERILFCSSFQHPFYPFSGAETINDHIINLPLPEGTDGKAWREQVEAEWLQEIKNFKPEFILFSAGFDGYVEDELANFCLVADDYAWVTQQILQISEESSKRRAVSVLEGGYDLEGLSACALAHVKAFRS